ncbi:MULTISPECIES: hypothetical protein [unclassified Methylococcus]|uniref:hypothetical protein n=1 Tax=unclassified Methylococcus TaxID=2618889 RepID=UPI003D7D53AA
MPTTAYPLARSPVPTIDALNPGDRRVLNSPKTLQRWRSEGRGPRYLKLSKRVSYPLEAVIEFEHAALHDSTSERSLR